MNHQLVYSLLIVCSFLNLTCQYNEPCEEVVDCLSTICFGQSPINIELNRVIPHKSLKPLQLQSYNKILHWDVFNTLNSIVFFPNGPVIPKFAIPGVNDPFALTSFHFHWSMNNSEGSEHFIDDQQFPLEMHIVHQNNADRYSIFAYLFEICDADNKGLNPLINAVSKVPNEGNRASSIFSLSSFIPNMDEQELNNFFRYDGSFTTSPYSLGVIWHVFKTVLCISNDQMKAFRDTQIERNFRPLQKLAGRNVYTNP